MTVLRKIARHGMTKGAAFFYAVAVGVAANLVMEYVHRQNAAEAPITAPAAPVEHIVTAPIVPRPAPGEEPAREERPITHHPTEAPARRASAGVPRVPQVRPLPVPTQPAVPVLPVPRESASLPPPNALPTPSLKPAVLPATPSSAPAAKATPAETTVLPAAPILPAPAVPATHIAAAPAMPSKAESSASVTTSAPPPDAIAKLLSHLTAPGQPKAPPVGLGTSEAPPVALDKPAAAPAANPADNALEATAASHPSPATAGKPLSLLPPPNKPRPPPVAADPPPAPKATNPGSGTGGLY